MTFKTTKLIQIGGFSNQNISFAQEILHVLTLFDAVIINVKQDKIGDNRSINITCSIEDISLEPFKSQLALLNDNNTTIIITDLDNKTECCLPSEYRLTIVKRNNISASLIEQLIKLITLYNLDLQQIRTLAEPTTNRGAYASFQILFAGKEKDKDLFETDIRNNYKELVDFSIQKDSFYDNTKRLACFDMDSTLIQTEVIDELAMRAGVGDRVKAITASAMRGEIDFKQSFAKRVSLLEGLDEGVMIEIANNLPFTEGLDRLMHTLKKSGYIVAILSGGFTYFAKYIQKRYNIDYVFANNLDIKDGKLTGKYIGEVVDAKLKVELLHELAHKEGIEMSQTVVVGDGANDLLMINDAGLGIAFHAKPKVQEQAKHIINSAGIDGILYFLGFSDHNLQELDF